MRWSLIITFWLSLTSLVLIIYFFSIQTVPLTKLPFSTVMYDSSGQLIGAKIAEDGQWRFPPDSKVADKFSRCLITFEDRRFYHHPGFDPLSLVRAMWQNLSSGRIKSGASTLTMQVIRLSRTPKMRSWKEKLIELILATRLELTYSKEDILRFYTHQAPLGGNVVGLPAACWRYFGKSPESLSWAEAATLAVLPNQPGLIHPGRNRIQLGLKRDRLLRRMHHLGHITAQELELALLEPLPENPLPLPQLASHLLHHLHRQYPAQNEFHTTIAADLQERLVQHFSLAKAHLKNNQIHNAAALIMDLQSGRVLAYLGNLPGTGAEHNEYVDCLQAPRSSGSILKPFLFAAALDEGLIAPSTLLPDVPTLINGYRPDNFHGQYDGLVPAREALIRSLNIPMVWLLQRYGVDKFLNILHKMRFSTIRRSAQDYGLSLILGGGETSLWDLCGAYGYLGRLALNFYHLQGEDDYYSRVPMHLLKDSPVTQREEPPVFSSAAAWLTTETLNDLHRPDEDGIWSYFTQRGWLAWKTGTSFGFRDAWAVGVNPHYVIGVWVGNADGEGRPECTGAKVAAPLLLQLFAMLPSGEGPAPPYDQMGPTPLCDKSGLLPGLHCPQDTQWLPWSGQKLNTCGYHQPIVLDTLTGNRLSRHCMDHPHWRIENRFVLPAGIAYYYQRQHPEYQPVPGYQAGCEPPEQNAIALIYPAMANHLKLALQPSDNQQDIILKAVHSDAAATLFWHLDHQFLGTTFQIHHLPIHPVPGQHTLTILDERGNQLIRHLTIE